jgi:hypothetical protein
MASLTRRYTGSQASGLLPVSFSLEHKNINARGERNTMNPLAYFFIFLFISVWH